MAQFFQPGANAFVQAQPQPLVAPAAQAVSQANQQQPTTNTNASLAGAAAPASSNPASAGAAGKGTQPMLFSPSAPGFFLYPAGASGELHALPVAPINATAGAAAAGSAGAGLMGPAFAAAAGGPPKPLFPPQAQAPIHQQQQHVAPVIGEGVEAKKPRALTGRKPTASGFYPAHIDATRSPQIRPVSLAFNTDNCSLLFNGAPEVFTT